MLHTCSSHLDDELAAATLGAALSKARRFVRQRLIRYVDMEEFASELVKRSIHRLSRYDPARMPVGVYIGWGLKHDAISLARTQRYRSMTATNKQSLEELLEALDEDADAPMPSYLKFLRDEISSDERNQDLIVDVRASLSRLSGNERQFIELLQDNGARTAASRSGLSRKQAEALLQRLRSELRAHAPKRAK